MRALVLVLALVGGGLLWQSSANAAILYETSFENETCDIAVPNAKIVDGELWCTNSGCGDAPGIVRCDAAVARHGTKYLEWHPPCSTYNASGRCTAGGKHDGGISVGDGQLQIPIPTNATVYLAGFVRFDRVANRDIWIDNGQPNNWDKLLEFGGHSSGDATRWGFGVGWINSDYAATNGKFTFDSWCASSVVSSCNPDHRVQNVPPYSGSNPFLADYGRWYAIVMEVYMRSDTTGYMKLYVNGINITNVQNIRTRNATGNIRELYFNGTWAQTGYDIPEHIRYMDHVILTTSLSDITNGGFMRNPEGGGDMTPPAAPTNLSVQ